MSLYDKMDRKTTYFKNLRYSISIDEDDGKQYVIFYSYFVGKYKKQIAWRQVLEFNGNKRILPLLRRLCVQQYERSDEYRANPWRYKEPSENEKTYCENSYEIF